MTELTDEQHAALSYLRDYLERSTARLEETLAVTEALATLNDIEKGTWWQAKMYLMYLHVHETSVARSILQLLEEHGYHSEES